MNRTGAVQAAPAPSHVMREFTQPGIGTIKVPRTL